MNAQELYQKIDNEYKPIRYYCENCGTIYSTKELAEDCCKSYFCSKCGKEIIRDRKKGIYNTYKTEDGKYICGDCWIKEQEAKYPTITEDEYKGQPIFWGDEFYMEFEDFIDDVVNTIEVEEDIPDYVFLSEEVPVVKIDTDGILERLYERNELDSDYVNIECVYRDLNGLIDFITEWNNKQTGTVYQQSNTKLILSDKTKQEIKDALKENV